MDGDTAADGVWFLTHPRYIYRERERESFIRNNLHNVYAHMYKESMCVGELDICTHVQREHVRRRVRE